jgi:integrase
MITLPNGCSCSKLVVYPKNWQTKSARVNRGWFIKYRFYDPNYPTPKQVMVKGMNQFKTVPERQRATKSCLTEELDKLVKGELNPFKQARNNTPNAQLIQGNTSLLEALEHAKDKVSVSAITKRDLAYVVRLIGDARKQLTIVDLPLSDVSRKTIRLILESISKTSDRFNKYRSYLMILFAELCEAEMIESNPVREIKKKKITKHLRKVLTNEERKMVNIHLETNYPSFHRFLHIFYHSGARISELIRVKKEDVDLQNQRFKVTIRKGRNYNEVWKTIKDLAMPYWQQIIQDALTDNYLFSYGLKPGQNQIHAYQVTKRWYRLVKKQLGISADFYSLKHLHTTEVVDLLDEHAAAKHNEHTSTAMVVGIYDVNRSGRQHSKVKSLNNSFA